MRLVRHWEDVLDWLENQRRSPLEMEVTDLVLSGAVCLMTAWVLILLLA